MDSTAPDGDLDRLRAEVADWRRRAEMAEALSAERLARAEAAERALETTAAALRRVTPEPEKAEASTAPEEVGPAGDDRLATPGRTLRERWRRYVESIN